MTSFSVVRRIYSTPYWLNAVQYFAIGTMTLDHIARMLGLQLLYSSVGRFAFVFFAALTAYSYVNISRNHGRHIIRILGIGCLAQPFFWLLFEPAVFVLNICFSLSLSLLLAWVSGRFVDDPLNWIAPLVGLVLFILGTAPFLEYSFSGVALVLCWIWYWKSESYANQRLNWAAILFVLFWAGMSNWNNGTVAVFSACIAAVIVAVINLNYFPVLVVRRMSPRLWVLYYPSHLAVLVVLSLIISSFTVASY